MRLASLLTLLLTVFPASSQDTDRGKLLYETHCATCHSERLHHRDTSKIKTLADLRDEVARWVPQTKHRFTLDEREDVVQYLNASHYRIAARELIYGAELMSPPERDEYRRQMEAAGPPALQEKVRAQHRTRIRERARQRGVELGEPLGVVK